MAKGKAFTPEDDALLSELGVEVEPRKSVSRTPREERIFAGFEEIQRFVEKHDRTPQHGEDCSLFERLYAVRLDRIRSQEECRELLMPIDHQGILTSQHRAAVPQLDELDDDALLAELGSDSAKHGISDLRHVRSTAERRTAEEVASRTKCEDFGTFDPIFEQIQRELDSGIRETTPFELNAEIEVGQFFILRGQKTHVAKKAEEFVNAQGRPDARLRVIFDNGTESNMLMRSLQRALNKDEAGRRILDTSAGPLFSNQTDSGDETSGTIYVLRSQATIPFVAEHRELIHKIGVTTGNVERRIAGATRDPTFLMAAVEMVATYDLYNINPGKLESLIHRFFASARLDIEIEDRFGNPFVPQEWFLVPLHAINDAVEKIRDGSITQYCYDKGAASLVPRR